MPSICLDDHASVYQAPTAIPSDAAPPKGCVFRPFSDLDLARAYANKVCAFFAEHGVPAPVFVVRGPTKTSNSKYEVVDTSCDYTIEYCVAPPDGVAKLTSLTDMVLSSDAKKPLDEQAALHFMVVTDLLNPTSSEYLRDLSIERCKAFMTRGVLNMSAVYLGREGADRQMLVQFLGFDWPERRIDDIEQLFRGYLRAGVMPINEPLNDMSRAGQIGSALTALQYAVDNSKTRLMVALLDEGADETLVPKAPLFRTFTNQVAVPAGDLIAYIENRVNINTTELLAGARDALMRRHIAMTTAPVAEHSAVAHRRHRRVAL